MQRRRPALLVATLGLALVAAVQPAAALTKLNWSGSYYEPEVMDESAVPGATCVYEDNAGTANDELDKIRLHQFHTHAPYNQKTWVGFRMVITRNTPPFDDNTFARYATRPLVKKRANLGEVAYFSGTWYAPEGTSARYRAVIELIFYKPNGDKGGHYRGRLDAYRIKLDNDSFVKGDDGDPGHCLPRFPAP